MCQKYTSFELSEKIHKSGLLALDMRLPRMLYVNEKYLVYFDPNKKYPLKNISNQGLYYTAYDIFWEICMDYAENFFGENHKKYTSKIISMLQDNKSQKEIEKYIWDNFLFNSKNKRR